MIQNTLDSLFFSEEPAAREALLPVLKSLSGGPCTSCRLGSLSPDNPGFLWKGNANAEIAALANYPSSFDMSSERAFNDQYAMQFRAWLAAVGLEESNIFMTYTVHCRTPERTIQGETKQREPLKEELNICFPSRALRVLKALPNLKVVICLGQTAARSLLGGEPQSKTHDGFWFGTDYLPGVAVFCLPNPKEFDAETSPRKKGRLDQILGYFRTELLGAPGVEPGKIMRILKIREAERQSARSL